MGLDHTVVLTFLPLSGFVAKSLMEISADGFSFPVPIQQHDSCQV